MGLDASVEIFENLLGAISDDPMKRDPDGDYVITYGGAKFYARLIGEVRPVLQVFSVIATDLPPIPELYLYLNNLNSNIHFVRAFHFDDQVLIESEINIHELSANHFHAICRYIAEASDAIGAELVQTFGANPRWQLGKKSNYAFGFSPN